jgi:hypothetical protein
MVQLNSIPRLRRYGARIGSLLLCTGCVTGARGFPLYSSDGSYRKSSEVAKLYGEFSTIDGRNVVRGGQSFELLPGCHVVVTRRTWVRGSTFGGMVANTPSFAFAMKMQANRTYVVEWESQIPTGLGGSIKLVAEELDADGTVVAAIEPTTNDASLQDCLASSDTTVTH